MKAISLLQPWAELIVIGAKRLETRSRNTSFTGDFLVHASLGRSYGPDAISCRELCYKSPFNKYIKGGKVYDKLSFGAIIGKATIINTIVTDDISFKEEGARLGTGGLEWISQKKN